MTTATPNTTDALPTPGLVGRLIRLTFGVGLLLLLCGLLTGWRTELWAGRMPLDVGFLILVGLALAYTSYVFNVLFGLKWGQRTLAGIVGAAALAAAVGLAVQGKLINAWLGVYVWSWLVAFSGLLGSAHLLASILGTPGCEMRSFAHLVTRLRGGDPAAVACPGGIDRFDHIGSPSADGRARS